MLARISASSASTAFRPSTALSISRRHASTKTPTANKNRALLDLLKSDLAKEQSSVNSSKVKSLKSAIAAISKVDFEITSPEAVKDLDGMGLGATKRIREYLDELHSSQSTNNDEALVMELKRIPGIGKKRAQNMIEAGCKGLEDLQKGKYLRFLTPTQRASMRYAAHLETSVTREEAEIVADFIRDNIPSKYETVLVGSYRRHAVESSKIKVMLFHPDHVHVPVPPVPQRGSYSPLVKPVFFTAKTKAEAPLHKLVLSVLQERGLIAHTQGTGLRYFHGVTRIPEKDSDGRWHPRRERLAAIEEGSGKYRRISIHMVPTKSRGAALIYHTGDAPMRKLLKHRAEKLGLYFDELGIWKWHAAEGESDSSGELSSGFWQLLNSTTEEAVFEQLGMDYVDPHRRNLAQVH